MTYFGSNNELPLVPTRGWPLIVLTLEIRKSQISPSIWTKLSTWTNNCYIGKVNSVQEACAKCFAVHILKSEVLQMTKNIRLLVFSFSPIDLAFLYFLFCFFPWFARFQILLCEPQSIWRKLLVLS